MPANESFDPAVGMTTGDPIASPIPLPNIAGRYQADRVLGVNAAGGRVTYLAHAITPAAATTIRQTAQNPADPAPSEAVVPEPIQVVIKEFQFAQAGNSWQGYDAIAREFEILQAIDHPAIPRYIEQIETDRAVYLVQAYQAAPSLAQRITNSVVSSDLSAVYQATIDLLEILAYLQSRTPPILHRDLKPENILYSDTGAISLVDFGLARRGLSGESDGTASSLIQGTMGFMAPEQILNRPLTTATDLYGLGASLVCWLTGTPSDRIGDWIGEGFRVEIERALPQVSRPAQQWFAKLVAPEVSDRFDSARSALTALQAISFTADRASAASSVIGAKQFAPPGLPFPTFPLTPVFQAQDFSELQHSWRDLPLGRLLLLAIASGGFVWGLEVWWSLSLGAGRAIELALRSLLSI